MLTNCGDLYQKPQYSDKNPASFIMAKNPSILLTRFPIYQSSSLSLCQKYCANDLHIIKFMCLCLHGHYTFLCMLFSYSFSFLRFGLYFYYPLFFLNGFHSFFVKYTCSNVITILNIFKRKLTDFMINSLHACTCTWSQVPSLIKKKVYLWPI